MQSNHWLRFNLSSFQMFFVPVLVFILLIAGLMGVSLVYEISIAIGLLVIIKESYKEVKQGRYTLDYIAFVAMVVSLWSGQLLAGSIIALMYTGGQALESFASTRAYTALKKLSDNIPKEAWVLRGEKYTAVPLQEIKDGEQILIKKHEIIPLDGTLVSEQGIFNFANLTGEAGFIIREKGVLIKSGSVNVGETIELTVVGDFSSSTYHKIVGLVDEARKNPSRIVRLSEKANIYFTLVTFFFVALVYVWWGDIARVLAVLVIATPCPLIIAAPVAFISGMSRAARLGIIITKPISFEVLSRASTVFFDKTGTLTMGEPELSVIEMLDSNMTEADALRIAASIEIHSLHPLARAMVKVAEKQQINFKAASHIIENLGEGIKGTVNGTCYCVVGSDQEHIGITLLLKREDAPVAYFHFLDRLKDGAKDIITHLKREGVRTEIITGDTRENAEELFDSKEVVLHTDTSPEDKYKLIDDAHRQKQTVVMVGDGLNDAPALAKADVGIVFSGAENGSSIEAADVVVLDRRINRLEKLFTVSHHTVAIAKQSIYGGIGLSVIGMIAASAGLITPVNGALLQELIDVIVILNALRALRG